MRTPAWSVALPLAAALLAAGCLAADGDTAGDDFEVVAEVDPASPTTVVVRWTSPARGRSWVEYGAGGDLDRSTPARDDGSLRHAVSLVGLPPDEEIAFRAVTEVGSVEFQGSGSTWTLSHGEGVPVFDLDAMAPGLASPEPFVLGTVMGDLSGVWALDRAGRVLWFHEDDNQYNPAMAVLDEATGEVVSIRTPLSFGQGEPRIRRHAFDGGEIDDRPLPDGHHAFRLLPDGSVAYAAADIRPWFDPEVGEEVLVAGDALRILEPSGETWDLFSTWDWDEPERTETWDSPYYGDARNWTHANALDWNPVRGTFLFSLRNLDTVLEIDGETGEVVARYGGRDGYGFADGSIPFVAQHDPRWTPEGHLLLVSTDAETVALEYRVDPEARRLTQVWSAGVGEGLLTPVHGSAVPLRNGNRLVNFGDERVLREVTPDGRTAWEIRGRAGLRLGSSQAFDTFYGAP